MEDLTITEAASFAKKVYENLIYIFDREPYINHCFRVATIVKEVTTVNTIIITALLHDVMSETSTTYENILFAFGKEVADNVITLTNKKNLMEIMGESEYLLNKLNKLNADQLLIELASILDNVSCIIPQENFELYKRYLCTISYVLENLQNNNIKSYHMELIQKIALLSKSK